MTGFRFSLAALFVLAWSGMAQAREQIVIQSSAAALGVATAVAGELRALGMEVRAAALNSAVSGTAAVVIVCPAEGAPVRVRFAPGGAREVLHVVSGATAGESAIRVSELVRAHVLADSLPRAAVARLPEVTAANLEQAPAPVAADPPRSDGEPAPTSPKEPESTESSAATSTPSDDASAPAEVDATADEPGAPQVIGGSDSVESHRTELPEHAFGTAFQFGAGALLFASDLPVATSVEFALTQTLWGVVTVGLSGGAQAAPLRIPGFGVLTELNTLHLGVEGSYEVLAAGPFSAHAGVGVSAIRFEIVGETTGREYRGVTRTEWAPWLRATAMARVALWEHFGLYLDGSAGTLLTELRIYSPGADYVPEGVEARGVRDVATAPENQTATGLMATLGPAVFQLGAGLEFAWDF